uniref:NADH dehydrogenase subunit 6 n=1 Tax=Antigona lamellaris TaxID=345433 RepID=A0A866UBP5_9BIVA|nr:NADH dehydrogenase subunit 6 [Antigona lamellaris]
MVMETIVLFLVLSVVNFSLKLSHPLLLGMGLLMLLLVLTSLIVFYGSLYSFCLFMVMVGGVLVVFCYTISLVPYVGKEMSLFGSSKGLVLGKAQFVLSVSFVCMMILLMTMDSDWGSLSLFSKVFYFSTDWGIMCVWLSVLLFIVMVFSVSVAGKFTGALLA